VALTEIAAILTGEHSLAKDTGGRDRPSRDESPGLLITSSRCAGGNTATTSMTGWPLNKNSRITIGRRQARACVRLEHTPSLERTTANDRLRSALTERKECNPGLRG
jgi:hypothetical protein